ncbi:MAG: hypothetical protein U5L45_20275 [Saprospiraceae bacterium]|nr:hypothetical protein [Saprospiraceae bacterium]
MVHFSGFARKMNHLSSFCASEASAKVPFNAYFEFMYGFKVFFRKTLGGSKPSKSCTAKITIFEKTSRKAKLFLSR